MCGRIAWDLYINSRAYEYKRKRLATLGNRNRMGDPPGGEKPGRPRREQTRGSGAQS